MLQPANAATPATAVLGFVAQVRMAPPEGGVMLRATDAALPVTGLPPASWTATTGWVPKATPPVEPDGLVVKASLLAGPVAMVKLVLSAEVRPLEDAVSEYVPALSIRQPAKVATPAEALVGFEVQVRVAPAGVTMFRVTGAELRATVVPLASWTATTGWVPKATPPVELEGLDVNER